ncbi:U4/U5/U6 small nuclear ribonucleoprotein prp3 [Balamuthia mandrillaris]
MSSSRESGGRDKKRKRNEEKDNDQDRRVRSRSRSKDRDKDQGRDKDSSRRHPSSSHKHHSSSSSRHHSRDHKSSSSSRSSEDGERRQYHRHHHHRDEEKASSSATTKTPPPTPANEDGTAATKKPAIDVSSLLANIAATKAALQRQKEQIQTTAPSSTSSSTATAATTTTTGKGNAALSERERKMAELQAKIQSKLGSLQSKLGPIRTATTTAATPSSSSAAVGGKTATFTLPPPLLLDEEGREIDPQTGKPISRPMGLVATTLINKRVAREKVFKLEKPAVETDPNKNRFFDPRMKLPKAERTRKLDFNFVEAGTYIRKAQRMRTKRAKEILSNSAALAAASAAAEDQVTAEQQQQLLQEAVGEVTAATGGEGSSAAAAAVLRRKGLGKIDLELLRQAEELIREDVPVPTVEPWDAPLLIDKRQYGLSPPMGPSPAADNKDKEKETSGEQKLEELEKEKEKETETRAASLYSDAMAIERPAVKQEKGDEEEEEENKAVVWQPTEIERNINGKRVTHLVEHPYVLPPPSEPEAPGPRPLMLTKAERKKMVRRARAERLREQQEKVLLGLAAPPENRVRISNMMRVMGQEAVQDPTQVERKVREEMAKRLRNHEARNEARKLTPEQRKEKKRRKMQEDTSLCCHVALFKVNSLSDNKHRYKVDINAQENHLSGCAVIYRNCNLVVVEGGPKAIRRYKKLMLRRIDWNTFVEDEPTEGEEGVEGAEGGAEGMDVGGNEEKKGNEETEKKERNECYLMWEGAVLKPAFRNFRVELFLTEKLARKWLKDHNVPHYWDCAKWFKPEDAIPLEP